MWFIRRIHDLFKGDELLTMWFLDGRMSSAQGRLGSCT
jgi:hypothetical protein